MSAKTQLSQGIQAAKAGNKQAAQALFYAVLDREPRNEMAWVWLSYSVDSVQDRQICLENVLTINPKNEYAKQGLQKLKSQSGQGKTVAVKQIAAKQTEHLISVSRSVPLLLTISFWFGLGLLLISGGLFDILQWGLELLTGPTIPDYITSYQLWTLTIAVGFVVLGILVLNIAWALFTGHKIGFYASIIFSLCFVLIGPSIILISERPNYLLVAFLVIMPASILFLTLFSPLGFNYGTELASQPKSG